MNMPENSGIRLYLSIVCAFLCIGYLMSGITNNHEPNYRGEMPIEAENVNLDTVEMEPVIRSTMELVFVPSGLWLSTTPLRLESDT